MAEIAKKIRLTAFAGSKKRAEIRALLGGKRSRVVLLTLDGPDYAALRTPTKGEFFYAER